MFDRIISEVKAEHAKKLSELQDEKSALVGHIGAATKIIQDSYDRAKKTPGEKEKDTLLGIADRTSRAGEPLESLAADTIAALNKANRVLADRLKELGERFHKAEAEIKANPNLEKWFQLKSLKSKNDAETSGMSVEASKGLLFKAVNERLEELKKIEATTDKNNLKKLNEIAAERTSLSAFAALDVETTQINQQKAQIEFIQSAIIGEAKQVKKSESIVTFDKLQEASRSSESKERNAAKAIKTLIEGDKAKLRLSPAVESQIKAIEEVIENYKKLPAEQQSEVSGAAYLNYKNLKIELGKIHDLVKAGIDTVMSEKFFKKDVHEKEQGGLNAQGRKERDEAISDILNGLRMQENLEALRNYMIAPQNSSLLSSLHKQEAAAKEREIKLKSGSSKQANVDENADHKARAAILKAKLEGKSPPSTPPATSSNQPTVDSKQAANQPATGHALAAKSKPKFKPTPPTSPRPAPKEPGKQQTAPAQTTTPVTDTVGNDDLAKHKKKAALPKPSPVEVVADLKNQGLAAQAKKQPGQPLSPTVIHARKLQS